MTIFVIERLNDVLGEWFPVMPFISEPMAEGALEAWCANNPTTEFRIQKYEHAK